MRNYTSELKYLHVQIDPDLMREAKSAAAKQGKLLHEFVAAALRICLTKPESKKRLQ